MKVKLDDLDFFFSQISLNLIFDNGESINNRKSTSVSQAKNS